MDIFFNRFRDEILSGAKLTTIRRLKPASKSCEQGTKLFLFFQDTSREFAEFLLSASCESVAITTYARIKHDDAVARADGFVDADEMRTYLESVYELTDYTPMRIIRWRLAIPEGE